MRSGSAIAIVIVAALAAVLSAPVRAEEPTLRPSVTVEGRLVTLGDLVEGAGDRADTPVFRAPQPGTAGTVSAARIVAAAAEEGLAGVADGGLESVSVRRASRRVDAEEIGRRIAERLVEDGALDGRGEAEVSLRDFDEALHLEADAVAPLAVASLDHDPRTGRFVAVLNVADSRVAADGIRVAGRVAEMVEAPVLTRKLGRGETISAGDIAMRRLPRRDLPGDVALAPEEVVGQAARRPLRTGTTIAADSLMAPILVSRNDAVTIVYESPGLSLTARGRAVGAGARGDLVTVVNGQSNRTVEAEVTGPGEVAVMASSRAEAVAEASR